MYCIYRITNKVNGKTYIGQHKYRKLNDNYMGSGVYLKAAKKKYGIENFTKTILEFDIPNVDLANDWEQMYILFERAKGKAEYNIANGGLGSAGHHCSLETRRKISESNKGKNSGKYPSDYTRKKRSESLKGDKNPNYGKHLSYETKRKISESKKGTLVWNKGKPCNEYTKIKLSKLWKGKHWKLVDGKRVWY